MANNPPEAEVRRYLIEDNGWTEQEWDQFAAFHRDSINADGTTTLSRDEWTRLAEEFW